MMTHSNLWSFLRDPRFRRGSTLLVVALLAAVNVVVSGVGKNLAADQERNLLKPHVGSGTPRFDISTGNAPGEYWQFIPDSRKTRLAILCGMSQMYAINNQCAGDCTISEILDDRLAADGTRVFGLAAPNLSNEEALFLLLALAQRPETTPHYFVFGVCFDKLRNVDLREGYLDFLTGNPATMSAWEHAAAQWSGRYPLAAAKMRSSLATAQVATSGDDTVEARLTAGLSRIVPLIRSRGAINGTLQLQAFMLRNWMLRIKPTSKRPIIQSRYDMNREFLGLLCDFARERGIVILLYVIPLNPQADNPYIPEQYDEFKSWLRSFAADRRIPFANLEYVVPREDWGEFMGGPDFKHFKGSGHRRTAEAILEAFGLQLRGAR